MTTPVESPPNQVRWPQPGELWSLWDMLKINGSTFLEVASYLARVSAFFEGNTDQQWKQETVSDQNADYIKTELKHAQQYAETLGAQITAIAISETLESLGRAREKRLTNESLGIRVDTIVATWRRELLITNLFVLERERAHFFESADPLFGRDVEKAFPAAAFEIEEAGKCLALSRPTAAVFHLMRVIEVGLRSVSKCLGIPDPIKEAERNWGVVLKKIKDEIELRAKSGTQKPWGSAKDKQFFGEVYGSLDAVRVAWRNSTMHVENKYTDDEAEHIWVAVKGFMRKLASRCDEQGQPLA